MPMIRRGIHSRFGNFMSPPPPEDGFMGGCQSECLFNKSNSSTQCEDKCSLR